MTNWDDYRYLLAVDDNGSLAGAARALGVSHPTVSRRVGELERSLATCLLDRTAESMRLTPAGQRVSEEARVLAKVARLIELKAADGEAGELCRVCITASEGIAYSLLTPLLAAFQHERPEIAVDLLIGNRPAKIRLGEADIALRMGDPVDDNLVGRRIGTARLGLFGHESYLARAGVPLGVEDLPRHAIIESTGDIADLAQARWLREHAAGARIASSSNSILNQLSALRAGFGLVAMPTYLTADLAGARRLLRNAYDPDIDVWLLSEPKRRDRPEVRALLDFLFERAPGRLCLMAGR